MRPQLTLLPDDSFYDDGFYSNDDGGSGASGGGAGGAARRSASGKAIIGPVRNGTRRRGRSQFNRLSQRTCRIGRKGVADARAKLAALPTQPNIDLNAA